MQDSVKTSCAMDAYLVYLRLVPSSKLKKVINIVNDDLLSFAFTIIKLTLQRIDCHFSANFLISLIVALPNAFKRTFLVVCRSIQDLLTSVFDFLSREFV